jgi:hypothetical protein
MQNPRLKRLQLDRRNQKAVCQTNSVDANFFAMLIWRGFHLVLVKFAPSFAPSHSLLMQDLSWIFLAVSRLLVE